MGFTMKRSLPGLFWHLTLPLLAVALLAQATYVDQQQPLGHQQPAVLSAAISVPLFLSLERLARLVDIAYCIGNTGVRKPFDCISRCKEFPSLALVTTWSTGLLFGDNCGFIAVDHDGHDESSVTEDDGAIVVAFRGTYSITNTIVDLSTVPQKYVPYPSPDHGGGEPPEKPGHECTNCTVHMGFLESWENARKVVLPELKTLRAKYPSYPVHLVGHSLGGSVACLAALELKVSLGWDDVMVTTFGEPRLGNHGLAHFVDQVFALDGIADLEKRTYRRVTHINDPVPLLPPSEWGYMPHAGEVFISKADLSPSQEDVRLCVGDDDPRCSAGEGTTLQSLLHRLLHFRQARTSTAALMETMSFPARFRFWQLFFAHRDYFWRLGLCVPGGDPTNWGRNPYGTLEPNEL